MPFVQLFIHLELSKKSQLERMRNELQTGRGDQRKKVYSTGQRFSIVFTGFLGLDLSEKGTLIRELLGIVQNHRQQNKRERETRTCTNIIL